MKYVFNVDYVNKKKGTTCSLNGAVAGELLRRGIISKAPAPATEVGVKVASNEPIVEVVVQKPKTRRK